MTFDLVSLPSAPAPQVKHGLIVSSSFDKFWTLVYLALLYGL